MNSNTTADFDWNTPLDRGGVQKTLQQVAIDCGVKKSRRTACATATQLI